MRLAVASPILVVAGLLLAPAVARAGDLVLPRLTDRVALDAASHALLRQAVAQPRDDRPWASDPKVVGSILAAVPGALKEGCRTMWSGSGDALSRLDPLALYTGKPTTGGTVPVLLALRCLALDPRTTSRQPAVRYYDDRLAYLAVGPTSSTLSVLGDTPHCGDTCAGHLAHVAAGEAVSIGGRPGMAVVVSRVENPCCDGPDSQEESRVVWFRFDGDAARAVADVLRSDTTASTSVVGDGEFDSQFTVTEATIRQERDAAGNVVRIAVEQVKRTTRDYKGKETRRPPEVSRQVLQWSPGSGRFEP